MNNKENIKLSEQAVETFNKGFNCAQAVLSTYGKQLGVEDSVSLRIASGFGSGMARMSETCGAVTGAFMVLGLKYAKGLESKEKIYSAINEFTAIFKERNTSIICKELLGYDMSTPEGMKALKERGLCSLLCPKFVKDASEILEELFKENN